MKFLTGLVIVVAATGCKDKTEKKSSAAESVEAAKSQSACPQDAAELKTWIQDLHAGKPLLAPWPTGDAAFDAELTKWRDQMRESQKAAADPSAPAPKLDEGAKQPSLLMKTLEGCEPAKAQITKVGEAAPTEQAAQWAGLADAIALCDCKPSISQVKASLFGMQRGPDGTAGMAGSAAAGSAAAGSAAAGSAAGSAAP